MAKRAAAPRVLRGVGFEVAKDLGEVARIFVHTQHSGAVLVDKTHAPCPEPARRADPTCPEPVPAVAPGITAGQAWRRLGVDEERLERIADLVAHVRVRQVQTGQDDSLQLLLS